MTSDLDKFLNLRGQIVGIVADVNETTFVSGVAILRNTSLA